MGHADAVCHIFVDKEIHLDKAIRIILDSKTNYPAACNAVEVVLLHQDLPASFFQLFVDSLQKAHVTLFAGERAQIYYKRFGIELPSPPSLHYEFGDLMLTCEIVSDLESAIQHINKYSSSHTESIITENESTASIFLSQVDSSCVFHNASTRFADGFRFGLGAEVGISTSRIHARGPVGVDGLLTTKWTLVSSNESGDC